MILDNPYLNCSSSHHNHDNGTDVSFQHHACSRSLDNQHLDYTQSFHLNQQYFESSSKGMMPFSKVCDLGCGTGLMISFMSDAGVVSPPNGIVGIDLSGAMVEKARSKNLYETLHVGDMDTVLQPGSNYTLVCCCDVYPYVGDLNEPFRRVRQSLVGSGQGYFVFSTEEWRVGSTKEHGYKLNTTGRFVHSFEYVERMAVVNSFQVLHLESIVLRMNGGQPVHGLIGVVRTV